ncbi:hypothetical protein A500_01250 [Clostridium sartagoforme AAU1]|uniref:Uncharacterized protein n=1 Tax=Clostridium sartagoforme AAU1 TaxID=1202534 RepID=R9CFD2_9CLOT|nr:SIR2 family protein [Clostridium sartagoforme]EOR27983.1 hypothetical protein A500_01250 [Clostridium sartagoforme AAU1]
MENEAYQRLLKKVRDKNVVLWVGAGFSKVAGFPLGNGTIELIKKQCTKQELKRLEGINSLPDFAEKFVKLRRERTDLINILEDIFRVEITESMVKYHKKLTNIPQIDTIITTNYDELLEVGYGKSNVRIIRKDTDISSIRNDKIKIYKIHSDFDNRDDIVITRTDYTNFFRDKIYSIMWSHIKTILSQKTVLFIGYDLGDQNVDSLVFDIIDNLGDFTNENFVIAPSLPSEEIDDLKNKKVSYIDMTGEQFINKLEKDIKNTLCEDVESGKIDYKLVSDILKREGVGTKFVIDNRGISLASVSECDKEIEAKINVKFQNIDVENEEERNKFVEIINELNKRLEGKSFESLEISGKYVDMIDNSFNGIKILPINNENNECSTLYISPNPDEVEKFNMFLGEDDNMEEATLKRFKSKYLIRTVISCSIFKLSYEINLKDIGNGKFLLDEVGRTKINIKYAETLLENNRKFKFLNRWMNGENIKLFNKKDYSMKFELPYNEENYSELSKVIKRDEYIFSTLVMIQKKFGVTFGEVGNITYDDLHNMKFLRNYCENGDKIKCEQVKVNYDFIKDMALDEINFDINETEEIINLFGEEINLGVPILKGKNIYIEGINKVTNNGCQYNVATIKSNTKDLSITYK